MKTYIKVFLPLLIVFIFNGCGAIKLSKYDLKETYSEKQVLVYDKTISLSTKGYIGNMQFSPTNKDELTIVSIDKIEYGSYRTDHFIVIDLKNGKLKKDIKLDKTKDTYDVEFIKYSDDGKKLYLMKIYEKVLKNICQKNITVYEIPEKTTFEKKCEDRLVTELIKDKFTILDLETEQLSPYYSYNCDEIIPKELNNNEIESYCEVSVNLPINTTYFYSGNKKKNKSKKGIAIYDKNSFKPKKIITLDDKFRVEVVSEDGQYILFKKDFRDSNEKFKNSQYSVYDLKNNRVIHNSDTTLWMIGRAFIDKDNLIFTYSTDFTEIGNTLYSKDHLSILNLVTNEKKIFSDCGESGKKCYLNGGVYNLNNKYMMWKHYSTYYIFDKKDMKIVQEFNGAMEFAVSRDFKKVVFYMNDTNELHLFDIVQQE
ncbi:hypothetical protein [Aliarcobacter butzleri]|uniref:hypothetical protein n=1 Tax=Aliarcobacter butzleri TaxID=28197 RepID=UPI00214BFABC|nr:hypothetical protein [Aliarcobacter butzleri]MCP3648590.1 hypothetical protein [Arcobacter sp. DNRA7]MCR1814763.1 hypothetical protein [Aliarcobacter butzleri]